jgi:predicted AlkP superfamily pyrophosphatase or phosphodiesterase
MLLRTLSVVLVLLVAVLAKGAERPAQRVLYIGMDGTRTDALLAADAPHLKGLMDSGASSKRTNILGVRKNSADTISGPGWSNLLTGVWPDKHGVTDNTFKGRNYKRYPHVFSRIHEVHPGAKLYSYSIWAPIADFIVSDATESIHFKAKSDLYSDADVECAAKAVQTLKDGDPDVMFVYFGQIDASGHAKGFHPTVPEYMQAIHNVDGFVGELLSVLRSRPNCENENWLVLVCTDHGGLGTNHGGGHKVPEINTVFTIVNGSGAAHGEIAGPTHQVDLVATALKHLGITPKPEWQLDGHPIGLK